MHQTRSGGRHARPPAVPAPTAQVAALWAAVSATLRTIEGRIRYYAGGLYDARLGDQLVMLPVLHEWAGVTDVEVRDLIALLTEFETLSTGGEANEAAHDVIAYTREMIRSRLRAVLV
ncbi:MAG: hypothetical protein ACJ72D_16440 [Marmoricola sp.]